MSDPAPVPAAPVTFERPPVSEVAMAVQFARAVTGEATTMGRFWPKIADRFPHVETMAASPPMMEDFSTGPQPQVIFQMAPSPSPRFLLQSEARSALLQIQPDRFVYNWLREPGDAEYPRYRRLRAEFIELYELFAQTCAEQGRELTPTWCEVTYINPIEAPPLVDAPDSAAAVLSRLRTIQLDGLPAPEDTSLNEHYLLQRAGVPYGRFHVAVANGFRVTDNARIIMVTLTARGLVETPDLAGVLNLLDDGRGLIVKGFRDLTTNRMHEQWGLHTDD